MNILAIESSCDETAASVVLDGMTVLSDVLATSKDMFRSSGGVIPEQAARRQLECIVPVIKRALADAGADRDAIDALAVTKGPGLTGSLLVGAIAARTLSSLWKKPLIGVHHTLGHLSSPWLQCHDVPEFPILSLSVSGGHSDLVYRTSHTRGTLVSRTRDDAAGEAFDKGAALLGLPYPGGPSLQKAASDGNAAAFPFPQPLRNTDTLDFSFSGLKTALKYTIRGLPHEDPSPVLADLAASYQQAICDHLADRLKKALQAHPHAQEIHIVGGVSANAVLRSTVQSLCGNRTVRFPKNIRYCTDNAAMIGSAAFFLLQELGDAACEPFRTQASLLQFP